MTEPAPTAGKAARERAERRPLKPGPRPLPGADRAVAAIFGGLARLRGNRALHPDGVVLTGTFRVLETVPGAPLLTRGEERRALVRISRGAGLPDGLPDVLGCAIRVPDAYGQGAHQDLALATSRRAPVGRHTLFPARDYLCAFYSSVLPYRLGGETRILGAELDWDRARGCDRAPELGLAVETGNPLTVTLLAARPTGPWRPIAAVRLDALAPPAQARRLRFNPWNCHEGIRPAGALNALRDPAYRASQAASPGS